MATLKNNETPHDYRIKLDDKEIQLFREHNVKKILEVCSGDGRALFSRAIVQGRCRKSATDLDRPTIRMTGLPTERIRALVQLYTNHSYLTAYPRMDLLQVQQANKLLAVHSTP